MKKYISLLTLALLISCTQEGNKDLAELKKSQANLKEEISKSKASLMEVEQQIRELEGDEKKIYEVTVKSLGSSTFQHFFQVQGTVAADKVIQVNPEASGNIQSIQVKEGQRVNKGQVIAILDTDILDNSIRELEVSLDLANTVFAKQTRLWNQNIGSEIQYLQAKNNKESLDSKLETLKSQRDMYIVKAPFAGVVDEIFPKVGELASPQMSIARLVNLDRVKIESEISEKYLPIVKRGTHVDVEFPSIHKKVDCKVSRTGEFINPANRSYKIQIEMANEGNSLKPNMIATLKIKDFEQDNAVTIPSNSIQQDHLGNEYVYIAIKKGAKHFVEKRTIETGLSYENMMHVTSGLNAGDRLIMKGARSIKDGQEIQLISKKA